MPVNPSSARGARKAITMRLRGLPLARSENDRATIAAEIEECVNYLYRLSKVGEAAEAALNQEESEEADPE